MAVTIKDVAKLSGVSPSTVSRVIADNPRISERTKDTVRRAMETLDYKPNAIARNLVTASTKTLGLIIPNQEEHLLFKNPFFVQAMRGLSIYAQKRNYKIMYTYSATPEDDVRFVREFVNSRWVDGVVLLTAYQDDPCIRYLRTAHFPFVVIGRPPNIHDSLWVDNDNFQATYSIANYLIQKGMQRIGFIGGPTRYVFSKDRLDGFIRALELRNMPIYREHMATTEDFTEAMGYSAMEAICSISIPEAVVTTDDLLAFGALQYIKKRGLNVRVTGFNNTPLAEYQTPPLTSVDIRAEELGYQAARLLIHTLEGNAPGVTHCIVGTEIIERASTL